MTHSEALVLMWPGVVRQGWHIIKVVRSCCKRDSRLLTRWDSFIHLQFPQLYSGGSHRLHVGFR